MVKVTKFRIEEIFYYLFFGILLMAKGIGLYDGMKEFRICMLAALLCFGIKICLTEHTFKEYAVMAAAVLAGGMVYLASGEKAALISVLVVIGMKHVPVRRVFIVGAAVWSAAFFSTILQGLLKRIPDVALVHSKLGLGHMIRWSLGYPHPNVLHISYVILIAFFLYLVKLNRKQLLTVSALLFLGNLYIFMYSVSYTGLILTTVYLMFHLYFNLRTAFTGAEKFLMQCVFPACAGLSIFGPVLIKGKLFDIFNKMMNTRWNLSRYFLTEQKITLFGTRMTDLPNKDYNIDCSYVYALMYYGILLFAGIMILYFFTIKWEVRKEKRKELAIMTAFLVAGMSEPFLFNLSFKNLTLVFAGEYLYAGSFLALRKASAARNDSVLRDGFAAQTETAAEIGGTGPAAGFWNRPVRILPWAGYEFSAPSLKGRNWFRILTGCAKKYKAVILAAALAGMIAAGGYVWLRVPAPDCVYVDVGMSDYWPGGKITPDAGTLPEDFNGLIIGSADGETPMYELTGNILEIERVRGIVSAGLWGAAGAALAAWCVTAAWAFVKRRQADENIDGQ